MSCLPYQRARTAIGVAGIALLSGCGGTAVSVPAAPTARPAPSPSHSPSPSPPAPRCTDIAAQRVFLDVSGVSAATTAPFHPCQPFTVDVAWNCNAPDGGVTVSIYKAGTNDRAGFTNDLGLGGGGGSGRHTTRFADFSDAYGAYDFQIYLDPGCTWHVTAKAG
jgi:hypothetical protein